ncbi:MAG: hypothetical protein HQM15_08990 [Deltaproteobacteria bacterium]|nr:hypothetical protein [Deltaproteobacteria bacterium]
MTSARIPSSENAIPHIPTVGPVTVPHAHSGTDTANPTPAPNLAREVGMALQHNTQNLWRRLNGQRLLASETPAQTEHEGPSAEQIHGVEVAVDQSLSGINLQGRSRLNQTQLNALIEAATRLAAVGRTARVTELLARFERETQSWTSPWALASAERAMAGVWAQAGDHEKALQHLDRVAGYVSENPLAHRGRGARFCSAEDQTRLAQLASILPILRGLYASEQTPQHIEAALSRLRAKVQAHPENVLATELRDQLEGSLQLSRRGLLVGVLQTVLSEWAQKQVQEHHASQEGLDHEIQAYLQAVSQYLEHHEHATLSEALASVLTDTRAALGFVQVQDFLSHTAPESFALENWMRAHFFHDSSDTRTVAQLLIDFVAANEETLRVGEGEVDAQIYDLALRLGTQDRGYTQSGIQLAGLLEQRHSLGSLPAGLRATLELKAQANTVLGELQNFIPGLGHNVLQTYSHFLIPFAMGRGLSVATKAMGIARLGAALGFLLPCAAEAAGFTVAGMGVGGAFAYADSQNPLHQDAYRNFLSHEVTPYAGAKGFASMMITFATCHGWGAAFKALARPLRTLLFENVSSSAMRALSNRSLWVLDYLLTGPGSFYASGTVNQFLGLEEEARKPSWSLGFLGNVIEDLKMKAGGGLIEGVPGAGHWMHGVEGRHHLLSEARRFQPFLRELAIPPFGERGLRMTELLLALERRPVPAAQASSHEGLWHYLTGEIDLSRRCSHEELLAEVRERMNGHEVDLRELFHLHGSETEHPAYRSSGEQRPAGFDLRDLQMEAFTYEATRNLNAQGLIRSIADLGLSSSERLRLLQNALELGVEAHTLAGIRALSEGNPEQLAFYLRPFLDRDLEAVQGVLGEVRDFQGRQGGEREPVDAIDNSTMGEDRERGISSAPATPLSPTLSPQGREGRASYPSAETFSIHSNLVFPSPSTGEDRERGISSAPATPLSPTLSPQGREGRASYPSAETFSIHSNLVFPSPSTGEGRERVTPSAPAVALSPTLSPQGREGLAIQQALAAQVRVRDQESLNRHAQAEPERLASAARARVTAKDAAGSGSGRDEGTSQGFFSDGKSDPKNPLGLENPAVPAELLTATKLNSPEGAAAQLGLEISGVDAASRVEGEGVEGLQAAGRRGSSASAVRGEALALKRKIYTRLTDTSQSASTAWERFKKQNFKTKAANDNARRALAGITDKGLDAKQRKVLFQRLDDLQAILNPGLNIQTNPNVERVFIPHRGEIAVRIARSVHKQGMTPVIMVHEAEANHAWVRKAVEEFGAEARVFVRLRAPESDSKKRAKDFKYTSTTPIDTSFGTADAVRAIRQHQGFVPVVVAEAPAKLSEALRQEMDAAGQVEHLISSGDPVVTDENLINNLYQDVNHIALEARRSNCQAVHPGYGYKSEAHELVTALNGEGLILFGPSVKSMLRAGDKDVAKQAFIEAGIPVVQGTQVGHENALSLARELLEIGFFKSEDRQRVLAVLSNIERNESFEEIALAFGARLKAVGGGGGKGQQTVYTLKELVNEFGTCQEEGKSKRILAERFIPRFQHVEFQIIRDRFGNTGILSERECTLQEGDQKLIEIYPAEIFARFPGLREKMYEAVRKAAQAVNYTGHGTVEFMVDPDTGDFFAMEVNARIQVEHRVTELVTRILGREDETADLISDAIDIGRGLPLSYLQESIENHGSAVEVRLKAADPNSLYRGRNAPSPGTVNRLEFPESEGIHVETSIASGDRIFGFFDAMFAKLVVYHPGKRLQVLQRASQALSKTVFESEKAKADILGQLRFLAREAVRTGEYDNHYASNGLEKALGKAALQSRGRPIPREEFEDRSSYRYKEKRALKLRSAVSLHLECVANIRLPTAKNIDLLQQRLEAFISDPLRTSDPLLGTLAKFFQQNRAFREELARLQRDPKNEITFQLNSIGDLKNIRIRQASGHKTVYVASDPVPGLPAGEMVYCVHYNRHSELFQPPSIEYFSGGFNSDYFQSEAVPLLAARQGLYNWEYEVAGAAKGGSPARLKVDISLSPEGVATWGFENASRVRLFAGESAENNANLAVQLFENFSRGLDEKDRTQSLKNLGHLFELIAKGFDMEQKRQFVKQIVTLAESLTTPLTALYNNKALSPKARQLAENIQTRREFRGHHLESIKHLDADALVVNFYKVEGRNGDARRIQRSFARVKTSPEKAIQDLHDIGHTLKLRNSDCKNCGSNVVELMMAKPAGFEEAKWLQSFAESLNSDSSWVSESNLRRVTVAFTEGNAYPVYYTFVREPNGQGLSQKFVEATNLRSLQPFTANRLIEIERLSLFDLRRDQVNSDRDVHLYYGSGKEKEVKGDVRLFGNLVVRRAQVLRNEQGVVGIPKLEELFVKSIRAMEQSLTDNAKESAKWNRLFMNILPELDMTHDETVAYVENLATQHWELLRKLHLEKVVVRGRIRVSETSNKYREVLITITNPTRYRFEVKVKALEEALFANAAGAELQSKRVMVNWSDASTVASLTKTNRPLGEIAYKFLDESKVSTATPVELRARKVQATGGVFAYHVPMHMDAAISALAREHPRAFKGNTRFVELDLEHVVKGSATPINPSTGKIDYNHPGQLVPAVNADGQAREIGRNKAGVVIGLMENDMGLGFPVRRLSILGDLSHDPSKGSIGHEETARIIAAIHYAAENGLDIDWHVASAGAFIDRDSGVEVLDAVSATFREIVLNCIKQNAELGKHRVRMNFVVDDFSIGIMSYDISIAAIAEATGGVVIMTPRGSLALTGPQAFAAAANPTASVTQLPGIVKRTFPGGIQDMAGYNGVHGPNGEAQLFAPNRLEAHKQLLLLHYYTAVERNGQIVSRRRSKDPVDRDVTQTPWMVNGVEQGNIGDLMKKLGAPMPQEDFLPFLRALIDQDAPPPLFLWKDYKGEFHLQNDALKIKNKEPMATKTVAAIAQIGGQPVMLVFQPGVLAPSDSAKIMRAIGKADGRLPLVHLYDNLVFMAIGLAMQERQLTNGGKYGTANVLFEGPQVMVNLGACTGGGKVVVDRQLAAPEDQEAFRVLALEGAREQVLDGRGVALVVYGREILKAAERDARMKNWQGLVTDAIRAQAEADERVKKGEAKLEDVQRGLVLQPILEEYVNKEAAIYNAANGMERALAVASVNQVIQPSELRAKLIEEIRSAKAAYKRRVPERRLEALQEVIARANQLPRDVMAAGVRQLWNKGVDIAAALRRGLEELSARLSAAAEHLVPAASEDIPVYNFTLLPGARVTLDQVIPGHRHEAILKQLEISTTENGKACALRFREGFDPQFAGERPQVICRIDDQELVYPLKPRIVQLLEGNKFDLVIRGERVRICLGGLVEENSGPKGGGAAEGDSVATVAAVSTQLSRLIEAGTDVFARVIGQVGKTGVFDVALARDLLAVVDSGVVDYGDRHHRVQVPLNQACSLGRGGDFPEGNEFSISRISSFYQTANPYAVHYYIQREGGVRTDIPIILKYMDGRVEVHLLNEKGAGIKDMGGLGVAGEEFTGEVSKVYILVEGRMIESIFPGHTRVDLKLEENGEVGLDKLRGEEWGDGGLRGVGVIDGMASTLEGRVSLKRTGKTYQLSLAPHPYPFIKNIEDHLFVCIQSPNGKNRRVSLEELKQSPVSFSDGDILKLSVAGVFYDLYTPQAVKCSKGIDCVVPTGETKRLSEFVEEDHSERETLQNFELLAVMQDSAVVYKLRAVNPWAVREGVFLKGGEEDRAIPLFHHQHGEHSFELGDSFVLTVNGRPLKFNIVDPTSPGSTPPGAGPAAPARIVRTGFLRTVGGIMLPLTVGLATYLASSVSEAASFVAGHLSSCCSGVFF